MAAISIRRKSTAGGELEQLRADLDATRAELAEVRAALKAVAALTTGIGFHRQPATASPPRTVTQLCLANGVHTGYADLIDALFG